MSFLDDIIKQAVGGDTSTLQAAQSPNAVMNYGLLKNIQAGTGAMRDTVSLGAFGKKYEDTPMAVQRILGENNTSTPEGRRTALQQIRTLPQGGAYAESLRQQWLENNQKETQLDTNRMMAQAQVGNTRINGERLTMEMDKLFSNRMEAGQLSKAVSTSLMSRGLVDYAQIAAATDDKGVILDVLKMANDPGSPIKLETLMGDDGLPHIKGVDAAGNVVKDYGPDPGMLNSEEFQSTARRLNGFGETPEQVQKMTTAVESLVGLAFDPNLQHVVGMGVVATLPMVDNVMVEGIAKVRAMLTQGEITQEQATSMISRVRMWSVNNIIPILKELYPVSDRDFAAMLLSQPGFETNPDQWRDWTINEQLPITLNAVRNGLIREGGQTERADLLSIALAGRTLQGLASLEESYANGEYDYDGSWQNEEYRVSMTKKVMEMLPTASETPKLEGNFYVLDGKVVDKATADTIARIFYDAADARQLDEMGLLTPHVGN